MGREKVIVQDEDLIRSNCRLSSWNHFPQNKLISLIRVINSTDKVWWQIFRVIFRWHKKICLKNRPFNFHPSKNTRRITKQINDLEYLLLLENQPLKLFSFPGALLCVCPFRNRAKWWDRSNGKDTFKLNKSFWWPSPCQTTSPASLPESRRVTVNSSLSSGKELN